MDKKSFVVAAIPAFNEERTIGVVVLQVEHVDTRYLVVMDEMAASRVVGFGK